MYNDLVRKYTQLNNDLHVSLGKRETLSKKLEACKTRLSEIDTTIETYSKASVFLQTLSDETRQAVLNRISSIVTDALKKIKDPDLQFKMVLSTERNQVELKFLVVNEKTTHEYDILNSCGGSIADIVSFPLKFSLLMKWDPSLSRLMILDENFKFVSVADQEPLGEFVRQISEKLDLQIILVSHSPMLAAKAHKIFHVSQKNGESTIEERPS